MASPVRRAARAAARWTRSSGARDPRLVRADLADDPGADAGLPHPVGRLADQLVGQVVDGPPVDARLRRVVRAAIPAAAHDDVQAAGPRRAAQPLRVAPDARQGQVDEAAPAGGRKRASSSRIDRLVAGQLPVVPAARDVPQRDLGVLVGQREPERRPGRSGRGPSGRGPWRRDATPSRRALAGSARSARRRLAASSSSSTARARRSDRPGGSVVAGLDPLQQQPVQQREEPAREPVDVHPGRQLAARDALAGAAAGRPRPGARAGGPACRGPRARVRLGPGADERDLAGGRRRSRRWSRRSRRWRSASRSAVVVGGRQPVAELLEAAARDQVAGLEEQLLLAREVRVDRPDRQAARADDVGDGRARGSPSPRRPRAAARTIRSRTCCSCSGLIRGTLDAPINRMVVRSMYIRRVAAQRIAGLT